MRPHYHYAAAANWLSDPNGLVFAQGEWHLFYQYNPQGEEWGHMSWGHAVSRDLAAWQELPVAIAETPRDLIFSGSAVTDAEGVAGFGKDALIAFYTAAAAQGPAHQSQAVAYSTDRGRSWTHYAGNPVIDLGLADFRDPNVFWHHGTQRWIMVVVLSAENRAVLYASRDLLHWDELSAISGTGAPGQVWECPLLIELPVEGTGESRWLFKVDVLHGGPGSGAIYQTGTFDGIRFHPDGPAKAPRWLLADHGSDFYAAVAWHEPRDEQGRPVWIGWMGNHAYQGQLPKQGWRGAMSLPRRLSLVRRGDDHVLRQEAVLVGVAQTRGVRHLLAQRLLRLFGQRAQQWGLEQAGGDGADADQLTRQVAGDRQGHADDTALGRRVRCLADLTVERRHRGRVDDDALLAVDRLGLGDALGRQPDDVERADQVDLDDLAEPGQRERTVLAQGLDGVADAGAVDVDADRPHRLGGVQGGGDACFIGDVGGDELGSRSEFGDDVLTLEVDHDDTGPGVEQALGGGQAQAGGPAGDDGDGIFDLH